MNTIKDLKEITNIDYIAIEQLFKLFPNYEIAKLIEEQLDCTIEEVLAVINNLVPKVDIYYKCNNRYYHVYKYSMLLHEYTAEVVYSKKLEDSDGNSYIKYYTEITPLSILDFEDAEAITKEDFEFVKA